MKISILSFLLIFSSACFAQQKDYSITVKSTGSRQFKYVYLYTWISSSMQRKELLPAGVEFKGKYDPITPDGAYQSAFIVVSDLEIAEKDLSKQPELNKRDFLIEPK